MPLKLEGVALASYYSYPELTRIPHADPDIPFESHGSHSSLEYDYLHSLVHTAEQDDPKQTLPLPSTPAIAPTAAERGLRVRSLLHLYTKDLQSMSVEPAPGSPPDLTSSKSSKSSSFRSSSLDDTLSPSDVSHFEDITLDDLHHALPGELRNGIPHRFQGGAVKALPSPRTFTSPRDSKSVSQMRDLTNSARPKYPSLKGQINGALGEQQGLGPVNTRSLRRSYTNSSTSSIPTPISPAQRSSRQPSPSSRQNPSFSPRLSPRSSSSQARPSPSPITGPVGRRQSWQPGRKTIKELEAEYHDSDEDVPEDAVIWNVPLSPRPPSERSVSHSPERALPGNISGSDLSKSPSRHTSAPPLLPNRPSSSPRLKPRPTRPQSTSMNSFPDGQNYSRSRTKSWTAAMADLSEEARFLTAALEVHAENNERQHEQWVQSGAPRRLSTQDKGTVTASSIELPPVRKGDLMIDPLPVSKEKEKVLCRTRPSWLPPKDPKEERRHLKEYQRMMSYSFEAEKRKAAKVQQAQILRDDTRASISRIWEQHVLPNWDAVVNEPRTRELWWRGITPRNRGAVWQKAVGNELQLTNASYEAALSRAKALDRKLAGLGSEERSRTREAAWFDSIRRDVKDTFTQLRIFQSGGPLNEPLLDVLMAYAMYRSDVGYVYGTHLPAALLLLNLPAQSAFITLANLLNRPLPSAFLVHDTGAMARAHSLVLQTLHYKRPALHGHLTSTLGLTPAEFLDPLLRTLCCAKLGVDAASRVWDVVVFEGDRALVRAVVGTLMVLEGRVLGEEREKVLRVLGWDDLGEVGVGGEDEFMGMVKEAGKVDK